ncbi:hypothetical protein C8J56DRAFT_889863 [Mycena floridula]|nr:hypothetical protein C8J56DRAFT_889863 [Mycena floridula]
MAINNDKEQFLNVSTHKKDQKTRNPYPAYLWRSLRCIHGSTLEGKARRGILMGISSVQKVYLPTTVTTGPGDVISTFSLGQRSFFHNISGLESRGRCAAAVCTVRPGDTFSLGWRSLFLDISGWESRNKRVLVALIASKNENEHPLNVSMRKKDQETRSPYPAYLWRSLGCIHGSTLEGKACRGTLISRNSVQKGFQNPSLLQQERET